MKAGHAEFFSASPFSNGCLEASRRKSCAALTHSAAKHWLQARAQLVGSCGMLSPKLLGPLGSIKFNGCCTKYPAEGYVYRQLTALLRCSAGSVSHLQEDDFETFSAAAAAAL